MARYGTTKNVVNVDATLASEVESFVFLKDDDVLVRCGRDIVTALICGFQALLDGLLGHTQPDLISSKCVFADLLELAHQRIESTSFDKLGGQWLRLFVDSTVGLIVAQLSIMDRSHAAHFKETLDCIGLLDKAIIIAGAVGRESEAQLLMTRLQAILSNHTDIDRREPNPQVPRSNTGQQPRLTSREEVKRLSAPQPIPMCIEPPTLSAFLARCDSPFVIPGYLLNPDPKTNPYALGWPALENWQCPQYLYDSAGHGRLVPVEVGTSYTDADWTQRILPFKEFLTNIGLETAPNGIKNDTAPMYLAQYPLLSQFQRLESDITIPDYVYSSPPAPKDYPNYKPPGNPDQMVVNVWIGSGQGKVTSPAHTDPYYNCYAQVLGRKRVWIAPPRVGPHMYAYRDGQGSIEESSAITTTSTESTDAVATSYSSNTSGIPLFSPHRDDIADKFPKFYEHVYPDAMETILEPGDMLFMPPGWWHAMRGEGEGVAWSVSMWF